MSKPNAVTVFDELAKAFYDETGVIAPGKSIPDELAMCENISHEERVALWIEWGKRRAMLQARKDT